MTITAIHHVQLAMPRGGEEAARTFYVDVLGFEEVPKPGNVTRGGAWFRSVAADVHLGVEDDFRAARKAHPALLVDDLAALLERCTDGGVTVVPNDESMAGYERAYVLDPFGNRIELLQVKS